MNNNREDIETTYGPIDGGFHDLASFRAELGQDARHISDDDARRIIDENLREKSKLTREQRARLDDVKDPNDYKDTVYIDMAENMRARVTAAEAERKRLASELSNERARRSTDYGDLLSSQAKLRNELELEKMRRMYGDRFAWRSPGSLDDYLVKERLKREVKEELMDEKRRASQQKKLMKLWEEPKRKSAKSPKRKSAKSPKRKSAKSPKRKSAKSPKRK